MNDQQKTWNSNFVLDGAKLTRLHEELSQRLHRAGTTVSFKFTTNTRKNVLATRLTIADVLQLDNTQRDPLNALFIDGDAQTDDTVVLRAAVEFTRPTNGQPKQNVRLRVSGVDQVLVNELFAAGSEQVERALVKPWAQIAALTVLAVIFTVTIAAILEPSSSLRFSRPALSRQDVTELAAIAAAAHTQEARTDFVFEVERREVGGLARQYETPAYGRRSQTGTIVGGAMILLVCSLLLYLSIVCYPAGVFAWGDYGEYYGSLLSRRRGIWKFLLITVAAGLLVSLVAVFLQSWLHVGGR